MKRTAVLWIAVLGCGGASTDQLRTRAAFDLNCPEKQLELVEIDGRTEGVMGCGKRGTYVESCERYGQTGGKTGCSWVLNSAP